MSKLQQAPVLSHQGKEFRSKGFWKYDTGLMEHIMNSCTLNELKLMLYLMGNSDGWGCSTENIIQRTGIPSKQAISKARQDLIKKGWLSHKEGESITVHYDAIYQDMESQEGNEKHDPIETTKQVNIPPKGNEKHDPLLRGHEKNDPQGHEKNDPSEVKNITIISTKLDNTQNNNSSATIVATHPPLEEIAAIAKKVSVNDPKTKKLIGAEKPYPNEPILYKDGQYYCLTTDQEAQYGIYAAPIGTPS